METKLNGKQMNLLGRHGENLEFYWTGSGIEFCTDASDVVLTAEACYDYLDIWLTVEVNGSLIERTMLLPGINRVGIIHSMEAGKSKRIRILKETQNDAESLNHCIKMIDLTDFEGKPINLLPPPQHKLTIDFYGDSLTTGEGLHGTEGEMAFVAAYMGFNDNYARITADSLDANYRIVSQSGWGVYAGFDNSLLKRIPRIYNLTDGRHEVYDFKNNPADYVVINLGTNDWVAFGGTEWQDETGAPHKLKLDSEGNPVDEDVLKVKNGVTDFINELLIIYPDAKLIWMLGMLETKLIPVIEEAVKACSNPERIVFLKLISADKLDYGSREHPGIMTHRCAAEKLIGYIQSIEEEKQ